MGDKLITGIIGVLTAVIGVAIIAVLVSKNANTGSVLTSAGTSFSSIITAAVAPVSGNSSSFGGLQI